MLHLQKENANRMVSEGKNEELYIKVQTKRNLGLLAYRQGDIPQLYSSMGSSEELPGCKLAAP